MKKEKAITKKFLIKQGFKKVKVSKEESGGKAFYYYNYDFGHPDDNSNLSLITQASDEVKDGWQVNIFDTRLYTKNRKAVKNFIKVVNKFI